jgi:glycosyltransferase involved in cell wall biosynthesis
MNILFISSYFLFSQTRFGGSKRLYLLAKELTKHADVSVICLDGCRELSPTAEMPRTHPDFGHFLHLPWTDSRGVFGKVTTPGIIIEDMLKRNAEVVAAFLGTRTYDAALLAFPLSLSFIGTAVIPGKFPLVYLEDDLLVEKVRTERLKGLLGRIYRFVRVNQLVSFYRRKLAFCDAFAAISSQEKGIIGRYFPKAQVELLGYGIDCARYPFLAALTGAFTLGFIGNFRHLPNVDALSWFLKEVYPLIRRDLPGARMVIAGPSTQEADLPFRRYRTDASIAWLGDVADLREFYSAVSVFVNPIISGRGMRTKVIEAAAFGRPIVSTALGAEGLENLSIDIATTADDFAVCCRRLKDDDSRYAAVAGRNRAIVEQTHSIEKVCSRLLAILSPKTGPR